MSENGKLEDVVRAQQANGVSFLSDVRVITSKLPGSSGRSRVILSGSVSEDFLARYQRDHAVVEQELGASMWSYVRQEGWLASAGTDEHVKEAGLLFEDPQARVELIDGEQGKVLVVIGSYSARQ